MRTALKGAAALCAVVACLLAAAPGPSTAARCGYPSSYPGDDAPKEAIAAWMAGGARAAGIPAELPVMGALASSELTNLSSGDADTAGYFQMRIAVWDTGDYAGFRTYAPLQLQWFIDRALAVRQKHLALGNGGFGDDAGGWGEWVAEVESAAEPAGDRYQQRLADARAAIAAGCVAASDETPRPAGDPASGGQPAPPTPDAQLIPKSVLPTLRISAPRRQDAAAAGALIASAACTNENCFVTARATIAVPGRGLYRVAAAPQKLERGRRATFALRLGKPLRGLVATADRRGVLALAAVRLVAANAGGYRMSASRTIVLGRKRSRAGGG